MKFTGSMLDAVNIGKTVGQKLLDLAGKKFKKNEYFNNKTSIN